MKQEKKQAAEVAMETTPLPLPHGIDATSRAATPTESANTPERSAESTPAAEEEAAERVATEAPTASAKDDGHLDVGEMKMYREIVEGLMEQLEDRFKDTLRAELEQITAPIEKARQEAYTAGRNDAIAETWDKPLPAPSEVKPLFERRKSVWE